MLPLLERFQNHTITLEECYQLRSFLERSLEQQLPISHQRVILTLTLSALNSLILDKEALSLDAEQIELPLVEQDLLTAGCPPGRPRHWWSRLIRSIERFFYGDRWIP